MVQIASLNLPCSNALSQCSGQFRDISIEVFKGAISSQMYYHDQSLHLGAFLITSGLTMILESQPSLVRVSWIGSALIVLKKGLNWTFRELLCTGENVVLIFDIVFSHARMPLGIQTGFLVMKGWSKKLAFLPPYSRSRNNSGIRWICVQALCTGSSACYKQAL